ncbi:MFS transporter [Oceanobacillus sp. CFH 90083]|uniref:MFS transporter n=1 Tax=Oceanobacillus sp. CFH 90083 TaxID=2592336 RepID=UPI00128E6C66|nr:MFS transporter [Oceanobacillus sp. CFH 90083]
MNNNKKKMKAEKKQKESVKIPSKAGMKQWIGLAVLALPTLIMTMDISVLFLALPHLAADLAPSSTQMLWIVDIYGFVLAGFLVIMGKLADRIGRRKLLMIGATLFGIASILVAYSNSAEMLIVSRALLGIAGATLMPSTLSLIRHMFQDAKQRSSAISVWMMCFVVGSVIGPIVGGLMLEWFWWGSVFLLGVPFMLLLLVTGPVLLPEYKDLKSEKLDLISAVMSLLAILAIVYGIKNIAEQGFQVSLVLIIAAGLLIGWAFVHRQNRMDDPLIDMRLFRTPAFSGALCILLLGLLTISGLNLYIAQYLQLVQALSPLIAGLWLVPFAAGVIIGSIAAPLIARRISPAYVIGISLVIASAGLLFLTQVEPTSGLTILIVGSVIFAIGISPLTVLGTDLIVGSAPPEKAGSASAISETSAELGAALGIAIMGSIATAVYQRQVSGSLPADVSSSAAEATEESLVGALEVTDSVPADTANKLLTLAQEAFTNGINTIAAVSAVLVILLAIFSVIMLRHVRPSGEE